MEELENIMNDTTRILEDDTSHDDLFGFWIEGILLVIIIQKTSLPSICFFLVRHIFCGSHRQLSLYPHVFSEKNQGTSSTFLT